MGVGRVLMETVTLNLVRQKFIQFSFLDDIGLRSRLCYTVLRLSSVCPYEMYCG